MTSLDNQHILYDQALFVRKRIERILFLSLFFGFCLVIYQISFPKELLIHDIVNNILRQIPRFLIPLYFVKWIIPYLRPKAHNSQIQRDLSDLLFALLLGTFHFTKASISLLQSEWFLYILLSLIFGVKLMRQGEMLKNSLLNPSILLTFSFSMTILLGTALLLIPGATNGNLSFIDALFTATSAVCITGLSTVDVSTKFTTIGQGTILVLIQIGGLGLMTFTNFFAYLFRGGMSFHNHLILSNILETNDRSSLFGTLLKILVFTVLVEFFGALLIFLLFLDKATIAGSDTLFFSVFHTISAFCNAGFSTVSNGLFHEDIRFNYSLQWIIVALIVFGGIGFPVVIDLYNGAKLFLRFILSKLKKERFSASARYTNVHSKLVLTTTFVLILLGSIVYFITEKNNVLAIHSTIYGKITQAVFGSVTPRTAGFNTIDVGELMQGTVLLYLLLMWIGASPSSTGGGIKTTTFTIAFLNVFALAKGKNRVEVFKREITANSIQRAFAVIFLSLMIIGLAVFFISIFEPHQSLTKIAFECFSAYSTVGLSMNLTPELSTPSKVVLIITMFLGRIGMFTFLLGLFKKVDCSHYKYPQESVLIV